VCVYMQETDTAVDWNLKLSSTFLSYSFPAVPSVKFQLLCVQMLDVLVVHGVQFAALLLLHFSLKKI